MRKIQNRPGSMVLSCVFFISICMLIMLLQWRSQEALRAIMALRIQALKKEYSVQALLQYGIEFGNKQYKALTQTIIKRKAPILLTFKRWPLGNEQYMQGRLEISFADRLIFKAALSEQNIKQIELSCVLERQAMQPDVYIVKEWKRHEINT